MLDALLALLTGGATGLIGTALSFATDYFQARQRHAQEIDLRRLDIEAARTEAAAAESERDQAAWQALQASYQAATRR